MNLTYISQPKSLEMKEITVMIVDNHTLIRETWARLLGLYEQYKVIANVGDGQEAIDAAQEKKPDLMLLDINMTPVNGFEVLKMVRKYSPMTKVVAVSMHSQPAYAKKMLRGGAKGYITKNSPSDELMFAIDEVLAGNTYVCKEVKNILTEQSFTSDEDGNGNIQQLSEREMQIISFIRDGLSSKEIAKELFISVKTVEVHRYNILKKLKIKNSTALIQFINDHGL